MESSLRLACIERACERRQAYVWFSNELRTRLSTNTVVLTAAFLTLRSETLFRDVRDVNCVKCGCRHVPGDGGGRVGFVSFC